MSEKRAIYDTSGLGLTTKRHFMSRRCTKAYNHPDYCPPTSAEVTALIDYAGWTSRECASLFGLKWDSDKGNSTLRKWKSDSDTALQIPYSTWRLGLIYAGIVSGEVPL